MKIFLIELPVFLLLTGKGRQHLIISFCLYFLCCSIFLFLQAKKRKITLAIHFPFPTIVVCLVLGCYFYHNWNSSGRMLMLSQVLNKSPKQCCIILAAFLSMLSVFGADYLLKFGMTLLGKKIETKEVNFSNFQIQFFLFLTAFIIITLNSKCSPVYPMNDWVDPNTMFTVGKGVLKGFVPYRDLYEQKGPLLIFFHTFGAAISFTSFIGMWILEIVFCYFFLLFAYKTLRLFYTQNSFLVIPILAFAVYGSYSFRCGDSAEEYCLPMLGYGIYVVCKALHNKSSLSKGDYFWIGVTSGCVFWIKYSIIGLYFGWILTLFMFAVIEKRIPELLMGIVWIVFGVIALSIPIFLYFISNLSLSFLLDVYFYKNLFTYAIKNVGFLNKVISGFASIVETNGISIVFSVMGLILLLCRRQWKLFIFLFMTFAGLFLSVYSMGRYYPYYSLVFSAFSVFGLFVLCEIIGNNGYISEIINKNLFFVLPFILLFSVFLLSFFSYNLPFLEHRKEDLMQYKMKAVIENSGIENPTLFYYNKYDSGITTVTGIIPNVRYFCSYNNVISAANKEKEECVRTGCSDFIIVTSATTEKYPEFTLYDHLGSFEGTTDWGYANYHIFIRKQE